MNKADNIYLDLLQDIIDNGHVKGDRTGTGTVSVFGRQLRFDMKEGFPLLTTKKVFTKGVIHELLWFLAGDTNIKYLVDNGVNIWVPDAYKKYCQTINKNKTEDAKIEPFTEEEFIDKIKNNQAFSHKYGELGPVYGAQWRSWGGDKKKYRGFNGDGKNGIDQIADMINTLKTNPDSRRIIINAWNPTDLPKMTLPPCHYGFEVNTRDLTLGEKLELYRNKVTEPKFPNSLTDEDMIEMGLPTKAISLMWHQRSVDTFLGLPFNIASYGILLHMIAAEVNMVPDELIGSLGDVHLYLNHIDKAELQLTREPKELPKLVLYKAKDLFSYKFEDIKFIDYDPHPAIKADISV